METPLGTASMVSTYDRSGGNSDWAQNVTIGPDGLTEIASLLGPGCVTRIWQTSVPGKQWYFFFDGETKPRLQLHRDVLFLGGRHPFVHPLVGRVSGGNYCYVPIPFEKSIRICVSAEKWRRGYYHINYQQYPRGTGVESFPEYMTEEQNALIDQICAAWKRTEESARSELQRGERRAVKLAPGETAAWIEHDGGGLLRSFWMRLDMPPEATALTRARLLRQLVLRIYWDSNRSPSVDVPLGDFFCNAFHQREYSSLAVSYVDGAYVCRFPMLFARSVRGVLRNDSVYNIVAEVGYDVAPRTAGEEGAYFHAVWNSSEASGRPHRVVDTQGNGHYVGCYLSAIGTDGTWNILEGDESIRVDQETTPSIHGTGLEDYFNGAWYYSGIFDLPLHGLVEKAPIRTDQYRFHILDAVPFNSQFSMEFEFGDANRSRGYMSSVAYWYQSEPVSVLSPMPEPSKRVPPADPLERIAIMAHLFELERISHLTEARDRCLEYAEKFAGKPGSATVALRALRYDEALKGVDAVRPEYQEVAEKTSDPNTAAQAKALLWFHEDLTNTLLGTHVNGTGRVYLDGKLIAQGGSATTLGVTPLVLQPGLHELAVAVEPAKADWWFSMHLRTHTTNVVTDASWEYCTSRPPAWPATGKADWSAVRKPGNGDMLPRLGFWQFVPNAFVGMQSGRQLLRPIRNVPAGAQDRTVYFRKTFRVPSGQAGKPLER
ncbi:glycoside hydrolase family 172 protein [Verrucomicrobiota bacterium]